MDYHEFIERSGSEVTREEYEKIETVYLNHPDFVDVPDLLRFWSKNGMDGVEMLYPVCAEVVRLKNVIDEAHNKFAELFLECDAVKRKLSRAEGLVELYRSMVKEDEVVRMITREEAEDALLRRD